MHSRIPFWAPRRFSLNALVAASSTGLKSSMTMNSSFRLRVRCDGLYGLGLPEAVQESVALDFRHAVPRQIIRADRHGSSYGEFWCRGRMMLRRVEIRSAAQVAYVTSLDSEFRGGCDLFDIDLELHDFLRLLAGKFRD